MPLWLQILFGAACIAIIGNACLHAYALFSELALAKEQDAPSAGRQITTTIRKLKIIALLIPRTLFEYNALHRARHVRSPGLFFEEKQAFRNAISYYEAQFIDKERETVNDSIENITLDFNSRRELFNFIGEVYRIDPDSGMEGSDCNGLRVPSSLLRDARFSSAVDAAKGTYTIRPDNEPKSMPGVHGLVDFCEAKIALLPF